jgi:hypothetical protein
MSTFLTGADGAILLGIDDAELTDGPVAPDPNYDYIAVIDTLAPGVVLQQAYLDGCAAGVFGQWIPATFAGADDRGDRAVAGGGSTTCTLVYSGTAWKAVVTHSCKPSPNPRRGETP